MKKALVVLFILFSQAVIAQNKVPFGGALASDTAWKNGPIRADGQVRYTYYKSNDTTYFFSIDTTGLLTLRHIYLGSYMTGSGNPNAIPVFTSSVAIGSTANVDTPGKNCIYFYDTARFEKVPYATLATDSIAVLGGIQGTLRKVGYPTSPDGSIGIGWPANTYTLAPVGVAKGGTGITSYSVAGAIPVSSGTTTMTYLPPGIDGQFLQVDPVTHVPKYNTITFAGSVTAADGSLVVNPTSGAVTAKVNPAYSNTMTATQVYSVANTYSWATPFGTIITNSSGVEQSVTPGTIGYCWTSNGTSAAPSWQPMATTTPTITVTSTNGLSGTVTSGLSPAITLSTTVTGIVKGSSGSLVPAVANTDYVNPSYVNTAVAGIGATAYTFTPTETFSVVAMNGGLSWNSGAGAINHITGPIDQTLKFVAGTPTTTTATVAGNSINITASNAIAGSATVVPTANGGNVNITGGNGATSASSSDNGGNVTVTGGASTGSNGSQAGGTFTASGGTSAGGGIGASLTLNGASGTGGGIGGSGTLSGGSGGQAGNFTVSGGSINASSNNNTPGSVTILGGTTGGGSGTNPGGSVYLTSTAGHSNTGGNAGAGGTITASTGNGGNATVTGATVGGAGGTYSVVCGAGGTGLGTGGAGGSIVEFAGLGGTGGAAGANGTVVMGVGTSTVVVVSSAGVAVTGTLSVSGTTNVNHLTGNGASPTIAAGAGAGTSPTVTVTGTDMGGYITIATGTVPTLAATIATITFGTTYTSTPRMIQVSGANDAAIGLMGTANIVYAPQANITTTTFIIKQPATAATALTAATTYIFYYEVIQ